MLRSNGDYEAARLNLLALDSQRERAAGEVRTFNTREKFHARSEPGRLFPHLGHELRAINAFAEAGKILHNGGCAEQPASLHPGNEKWIQVCAGGVDGRRPPGTAEPMMTMFSMTLARRVTRPFLAQPSAEGPKDC